MSFLAEVNNERTGWMALGGILLAVLECVRRLLGYLMFRDKDKADFRRELLREVGELRKEVKDTKEKVECLTFELALERAMSQRQRELKHHYRNKLASVVLLLGAYRGAHGKLEEDDFSWDTDEPEPDTPSSPLLEEMLTQAARLRFSGDGFKPITVLPTSETD